MYVSINKQLKIDENSNSDLSGKKLKNDFSVQMSRL